MTKRQMSLKPNSRFSMARRGQVCATVLTAMMLGTGTATAGQAELCVVALRSVHPALPHEDDRVEMGVKSAAVKKAVRILAEAIRTGSGIVHRFIGFLDDEAARVFRNYSGRIADELDVIAKISDITVKVVKAKSIYS